jgi:hypothetical protein
LVYLLVSAESHRRLRLLQIGVIPWGCGPVLAAAAVGPGRPRGSSGRVGPAAARWHANWPDFNRDGAAEAPVRTSVLLHAI